MSLAKKIAHNTLTQILGKLISTLLGLFSLALITRYLGPTGFGEYATVITFLSFFAVCADFGLTLITVQLISDKTRNETKILNNLFSLRLVSIVIFLALAPLVASFFPYSPAIKLGILIALASFVFPALNQIIIGLLQKKLSMGRDALAENVGRLVLLVGIILTQKFGWGLNGVLWATGIGAGINFLVHYFLSLKFAVIKLAWDFSLWKEIIIKSWPLALTVVLNLIYLRADTLMLSVFRSSAEVGLYSAPYKIIDVLTTLPFMFAGLILPIMTTSWLEGKKDYFQKILQKSYDFMFIVAVPLVIGTQFVAQELMTLVAGSAFALSGTILKILIISVAAIFLGTMFSHAVIALDKQKKMIGFYVFTSLSSLLAYLIFIPRFSYYGAAGVTIYSEILIAIFSGYCVFKYSHFKLNLAVSFKALAAGLIMAGGLWFFNHNYLSQELINRNHVVGLILNIVLAGLTYFIALYLLGGIKKNDLQTIFKKQTTSGGQTYGANPGI
jgi:O-antigen/teichoic acid export membrane protein